MVKMTKDANLEHESNNKTAPFKLLRYFTIIGIVCIVVASLLLGYWVRQITVDNLLKSEERNNITLTQLVSNSVWPRFSEFINSASNLSAQEILDHPLTQELDDYLSEQVNGLDVVKIKIYNLSGLTVYSSDLSQIGKSKSKHASFLAAKNGQVVSKLSFRDKIYAQKEFIHDRNIIASYVPVRSGNSKNVEGVIEIYKDVTIIFSEISQTRIQLILGVVIILISLFCVLYFVVRHADQVINQYNIDLQETAEKMKQVAFFDSLTGLPNRNLFIDRLTHAMDKAIRHENLVAMLFIDLDRFKQVNDSLGHEAGDQLLCQVADRLNECVRTADTVSRLSGDEFTIILEDLNTIDLAAEIAKRIISSLAKPFNLGKHEAIITCSVGISFYPFGDDNAQSLIKKADIAMYHSKIAGRNSYHFFDPDMMKVESNVFELEHDLRKAIEESQFILYFQPQVRIDDWSIQGLEALLRWNHPAKGMIGPDKFIPALEETGMIVPVGEWVIRESCRINKKWQDQGLAPVRIAVNISALQLRKRGFVDLVCSILEETKLSAEYLELELTESCLISNIEESIEILTTLRNKGIKTSIDDFGTGFSSLSYLSKLPIDALKIDRSFVRQLTSNDTNRSIITAIVSFAHSLRIAIVAEGVETAQQLFFLNAMRCSLIQGFLLSHPLSEADAQETIRNGGDFEHIKDSVKNDLQIQHNTSG